MEPGLRVWLDIAPDQQDSQKGLQAAVRECQGASPPWLPAWLPEGVSHPNSPWFPSARLTREGY
jgi:hypothetical protein